MPANNLLTHLGRGLRCVVGTQVQQDVAPVDPWRLRMIWLKKTLGEHRVHMMSKQAVRGSQSHGPKRGTLGPLRRHIAGRGQIVALLESIELVDADDGKKGVPFSTWPLPRVSHSSTRTLLSLTWRSHRSSCPETHHIPEHGLWRR